MQFNRKIRKVGNSYMITVPIAFITGGMLNTTEEYVINIEKVVASENNNISNS